jgi:hypothetical protein
MCERDVSPKGQGVETAEPANSTPMLPSPVVFLLFEPNEVGNPGGVGVAGEEDVVGDVVVVEMREDTRPVALISIPWVVVVGVLVAEGK